MEWIVRNFIFLFLYGSQLLQAHNYQTDAWHIGVEEAAFYSNSISLIIQSKLMECNVIKLKVFSICKKLGGVNHVLVLLFVRTSDAENVMKISYELSEKLTITKYSEPDEFEAIWAFFVFSVNKILCEWKWKFRYNHSFDSFDDCKNKFHFFESILINRFEFNSDKAIFFQLHKTPYLCCNNAKHIRSKKKSEMYISFHICYDNTC